MSGTLLSPGVQVSIINESFYGSAAQGTIPLVFMATAANKTAPSGSGIAPLTVPGMAGKLFLATSQRELLTNYGNPAFTSVQGTPVNGDELNEYGLHAAYSFLGISNQCYVLRADLDTSQLAPSLTAPQGPPVTGTYWLDLSATSWGLFRANGSSIAGSAWILQTVLVPPVTSVDPTSFVPLTSYGSDGAYAIVPWTANNLIYERINGAWYQIGSPAWTAQRPTTLTGIVNPAAVNAGNSITINGTAVTFASPGDLPTVVSDINAAMTGAGVTTITAAVVNNALVITQSGGASLSLASTSGTSLSVLGLVASSSITSVTVPGVTVTRNSNAAYPSGQAAGALWVKGNPANQGANWVVRYYDATLGWTVIPAPFVQFDSTKSDGDTTKDTNATLTLGVPAVGTLYVGYDPVTGVQQLRRFTSAGWAQLGEVPQGSLAEPLEYEADFVAPTTAPADGTYWYDAGTGVDVMVGDGEQWIGYRRMYPQTDSTGVILSGSAPVQQVGGHVALDNNGNPQTVYDLVDNDLWVDTSDLENYPLMYRWSTASFRWVLIDNSDHTTPFGIVFGDARSSSGPSFTGISNAGAYAFNSTATTDLALSDYVDPDCPIDTPANAHPAGVILFNTRASTGNVKVWHPAYFKPGPTGTNADPNTDFTVTGYNAGNPNVSFPPVSAPGAWVNASGNDITTLAPYMMRKAQRIMIVRAINALISDNQDIRSELVHFNLIAAPGYIEALPDMQGLNVDQKEVSFIIADTPIRLTPDATSLTNWATNTAKVAADGEDGLVTSYEYAAAYYPWGLGQDISGNEVMVPPSTIALRTMAYNDQVAYPWFAPAGFTRGLVTNATSVGYLAADGTYTPVILNQGQRDVLYTNKINPIAYIPGRGLVVYGQKTLAPVSSSLDRINVARLVNYIRYNLDIIVKPYLFEPNDASTQKAATNTVSRFFNSLIGLRGLSDYAVLCDSTNNTPDRVDANELWIDCAIVPIKAIEFIYIPVRIENTGVASINLAPAT